MEKYSAFRDAGTGIQPFLNAVPPRNPAFGLPDVIYPIGCIVATIRVVLVIIVALVHFILVDALCAILSPIPPLHRIISSTITALTTRLVLFVLGFYWIPVSIVSRKRGRAAKEALGESWAPGKGDLIVSNWSSWIELLWLAFRFNPTFIVPVANPPQTTTSLPTSARLIGRKTGTGSANIVTPHSTASSSSRVPILGYRRVSLLKLIHLTGRVPPYGISPDDYSGESLEQIRAQSAGPVVVFPECTTSNGRALLRFSPTTFAGLEKGSEMPIRKFGVFVMCVRYDPPTPLSPSLSLSIPPSPPASTSPFFSNPLSHIFSISTSLSFSPPISIRLLPPSEGPSSPTFIISEVVSSNNIVTGGADLLSEVCETLVAGLGKLKRTRMGWEEKIGLLEMYYHKIK